ncbi:PLP-dependent transferase [Ascobolus immersus RN42]|uniref:PLP-dependent transferase n=1 Tax=Ascobolus immersus RN42 TaxID=1160509 RepID=A0A3N4HNW7_ASCIM|nr:PLP-dependent transferase [Ascobolus immersus RN42]
MADSPELAQAIAPPADSAAATGDLNSKETINLLVGHPSARLFPLTTLEQHFSRTLLNPPPLHERDRHILTYGPDQGQYTVRRSLSNYLRAVYDIQGEWTEEETENLIVTGGASSTLGEVLKRCTDEKTHTIVVEPTYFLVGGILEDAGFSIDGNEKGGQKVFGVPWLSEEADLAGSVETLVQSLTNTDSLPPRYQAKPTSRLLPRAYPTAPPPRRLYDFILYLTPTFSNPTGLTPPPSFSLDSILGPGLRVGWLEGPSPDLVAQVAQSGVIKSGGSMGHFNSTVIRQMLMKRAVDVPVLSQLMMTYKLRAGALERAVARNLPRGSTLLGGKGGYFFYLGIGSESDNVDADEITTLAREEGVIVLPGSACMLGGRNGGRWVRLAVCYEEEKRIVEGVERLGRVVRRWYEEHGKEWAVDEEKAKVEEPRILAMRYEELVPPVEKVNRRKRAKARKAEEEKAAREGGEGVIAEGSQKLASVPSGGAGGAAASSGAAEEEVGEGEVKEEGKEEEKEEKEEK